jgi:hypothetical protein
MPSGHHLRKADVETMPSITKPEPYLPENLPHFDLFSAGTMRSDYNIIAVFDADSDQFLSSLGVRYLRINWYNLAP